MLPIVALVQMLSYIEPIFGFVMTSLSLNLLSYYYFRFLSAILIFGRRQCRPLSLDVKCMQLDCYFGFGTTSVYVTIGKLFVLPVFDRHDGY